MVVFMTTPRDTVNQGYIEEILCEDTVLQSTAVLTHIAHRSTHHPNHPPVPPHRHSTQQPRHHHEGG